MNPVLEAKEMLYNKDIDNKNIVWLLWSRMPEPCVPPHLAKTADRIDFKIWRAIDDAWRRTHGDVDPPTRGGMSVFVGVDQDGALWYDVGVDDEYGRWSKTEDELHSLMVRLMAKPQFVKDCRKMAKAITDDPESFQ